MIGAAHRATGGPRRVARGPRLGLGPLGPLADRRRPRGRGARSPRRALGARPPRAARQPRRARDGRRRRRHAGPGRRRHPPRRRRRRRRACCYEAATRARRRSTSRRWPTGGPRARRSWPSRRSCSPLGVVAVHDPGDVAPDPDLAWSYPGLRPPVRDRAACRSASTPRSGTTRLETALARRAAQRRRPRRRTRTAVPAIGWQKCFADGSLGSRTAALLADIEPEPDRPLPPDRRRGVWMTEPEALARARRPGRRRRHRDPDPRDRRRRGPGRARRPRRRPPAARPVHAPDRARPAARPGRPAAVRRGRASRPASSRSTSGRTRRRRDGCGATAPRRTATPGRRSPRPGRSSPSGPTRRSSRSTRGRASRSRSVARIRRWPAGTPAVRPGRGAHARARAARGVRRPGRLRRASAIAAG